MKRLTSACTKPFPSKRSILKGCYSHCKIICPYVLDENVTTDAIFAIGFLCGTRYSLLWTEIYGARRSSIREKYRRVDSGISQASSCKCHEICRWIDTVVLFIQLCGNVFLFILNNNHGWTQWCCKIGKCVKLHGRL